MKKVKKIKNNITALLCAAIMVLGVFGLMPQITPYIPRLCSSAISFISFTPPLAVIFTSDGKTFFNSL